MIDWKRSAKRPKLPLKTRLFIVAEKVLPMMAHVFAIGGNVAVIVGVVFAIYQFGQTKKNERVQNAINAVNQTKSSDFLRAYARVKTVSISKKAENRIVLIDDLNYVMNTYDHIALLYINGFADKCLVKNATYASLGELPAFFETFSYPEESRKSINKVLKLMDDEVCRESN